jgi:hypothetical protein
MSGICKLCLKTTDLKRSHIIPKFVWRWLRNPVPGGLRTNRKPNKRIQDGPNICLLCVDCEKRLSAWEKLFSERIFLPLHYPEPITKFITYEEWALKFAVSVSWRVLVFLCGEGADSHYTPFQCKLADEALETWRMFMLGEIRNPRSFEQHLLPVDVIADYQGPQISPFLNRYLLRNIHIDLISTKDSAYVYTKMCRLILFGRIQEKYPHQWKGMKLNLRRGDIHPRDYCLPEGIAYYINRKADEVKQLLDSLSPRQQAIADDSFNKNVNLISNSEIFRAFLQDFAYSDEKALSERRRNDTSEHS